MFKFLRKYKNWLMVVFGGALLLIFLVPGTIQEISRYSAVRGHTWARADGSKITEGDRLRAAGQLQTLETMAGFGFPVLSQLRAMAGLDPRDTAHWYLLVLEAQKGGFVGGPEEGRVWLQDQLALTPNAMTEAELLGRLAGSAQQSPNQVLEALANVRGVIRMLAVASDLPISDGRAKVAAAEARTSASAEVVILDASKPLTAEEPAEPTAEAIAAQFEKYRDTAPGTGEGGFGYRIPDRLKLEWFRIPADSVRLGVTDDPRLSELEIRKAYLKEPSAFVAPGVAGAYPAYEDVAVEVRSKVADRVVRERMTEIERFVEDQLSLSLRGVPKQGGYYQLTPEQTAKQPAFADLIVALSNEFKIAVPEYHAAGDAWMTPAEAARIQGLGNATTLRFGAQTRKIAELLRVLREFGGSPTLLLQEGVAGPPLSMPTTPGGVSDLYFFRVIDAEPAHAPASLEEVADLVKKDLVRIARYEQLVREAPDIEKKAVAEGLGAVATAYGTTIQNMPRLSDSMPSTFPGLGQDKTAVQAIMKRAMELPKTTPVADLPETDKTFVVESPEKLALIVVRLTALQPLSLEDYQKLVDSGSIIRTIAPRVPSVTPAELYGVEPLKSRYKFEIERDEKAEAEAAAAAAALPKPASGAAPATVPQPR